MAWGLGLSTTFLLVRSIYRLVEVSYSFPGSLAYSSTLSNPYHLLLFLYCVVCLVCQRLERTDPVDRSLFYNL